MSHKIEQLLENVNGNTILSLDTCTVPTLAGGKGNPNQGHIFKLMIGGNVMVFTNKNSNGYVNMISRRLIKEDKDPSSFVLSPRQWGIRIDGTPFVMHKDQMYLEVIFLRPGHVKYVHGLRDITKQDAINMGLKDDKEEGEQGGLENKVIIRTFKFDSISALTVDGARHVLK